VQVQYQTKIDIIYLFTEEQYVMEKYIIKHLTSHTTKKKCTPES